MKEDKKNTKVKRPTSGKRLKCVKAHRLIITDPEGKPRIFLDGAGLEGYATVTLFAKNDAQISLNVAPDNSASLCFARSDGSPAAGITMHPSGDTVFAVNNGSGKFCVRISSQNGEPPFAVFRNGQEVWRVPI